MKKPIRLVLQGQILRYGTIIGIGFFNIPAAVLLFLLPFISAVPRSTSIFLWHGLVDTNDPENVYTNSVNIAAGPGGIHAWHVEHHVQPNDHWSHMRESAERDRANYEREQTIVFMPHPRIRQLYLRAMWTRRFDLLATMCLPTCEAQRNPATLAQMIAQRTKPLIPVVHGPLYLRIDDWLGRKVSKYLVGGRFPVERRRKTGGPGRMAVGARRGRPAIDYVEG